MTASGRRRSICTMRRLKLSCLALLVTIKSMVLNLYRMCQTLSSDLMACLSLSLATTWLKQAQALSPSTPQSINRTIWRHP